MTTMLAVTAAFGTYLVVTSGAGTGRPDVRRRLRALVQRVERRWGLEGVGWMQLSVGSLGTGVAGAFATWLLFGNVPAVLGGLIAGALVPVGAERGRRRRRRATADEAWPRLIDELQLLTAAAGRSVPQALFALEARVPAELAPAFREARREWLLTTDFDGALAVLRTELADPSVDGLWETLSVAHEFGGSALGRRLRVLAEHRREDLAQRRDARAHLAGARFARRFVLLVPIGMALAGLLVGTGRDAYGTPLGQVATAVGIGLVAICWWWSGRVMRLPRGTELR